MAIWRSSSLICAFRVLIVATSVEHELPAGGKLELADATVGCAPELGQQLRRVLPPAVALSRKERPQARFAKPARVGRARVALKERERDPAVQIGEQA